jgi:hypothetical protein
MIDGIPWARPPKWIDPLQRLIRNTLHERTDQARGLGTQMRLTLPTNPDPPWAQPPDPPAPGSTDPPETPPLAGTG